MNITKEQIKWIHDAVRLNRADDEEIQNFLKTNFPEAFEPEVRECDLYTECVDTEGHKKVETGVWKIFDSEKFFYVIVSDLAIRFDKIKGSWFASTTKNLHLENL